jgi:RNA polymerase sigma-70 factor (ECF subfamily)
MGRTEVVDQAGDAELMRRVVDGDTRAFEAIHDRYRRQAFGLAIRITRQPEAAEDVVQEAFLNLWRGAARYRPARGSLKSWLLQIVHNRSVDTVRRGKHHRRNVAIDDVPGRDLTAPDCIDTTVLAREDSRQMRRLLVDLPVKQREVIDLAYYRELSHREMASDLGLPLGTVKGRLRLAHGKLHALLAAAA